MIRPLPFISVFALALLVSLPLKPARPAPPKKQPAPAMKKAPPAKKAPAPVKPPHETGEQIRSTSLEQPAPGNAHWLSLPNSRLVIHPSAGAGPLVVDLLPPSLPMELGYYAGRTPITLPRFWSWRVGEDGGRGPGGLHVRPVPTSLGASSPSYGPFATGAYSWRFEGLEYLPLGPDKEGIRVALNRPAYGTLSNADTFPQTITYDLDETPLLFIEVTECTGMWTLRATTDGDKREIELMPHTAQTGSFVIDVRKLTGWKGKRKINLSLAVVGEPGDTLTLTSVGFAGMEGTAPPPLTVKSVKWSPHQLTTQAELPGSGTTAPLRIDATTALLDEDTVGQRLRLAEGSPEQTLTLTGHLPGAEVIPAPDERSLVLRNETFQAVLTFSRPARTLRTYRNAVNWLAGDVPQINPPTGSFWEVAFENVKPGDEVIVTARFSPIASAGRTDTDALNRLTTPEGFRTALKTQETKWDARLTSVPKPLNFSLHRIPGKGVTPPGIRHYYYKAWVFLLSNLLPPMPENGYPYPQASIGKASLWKEGAPQSRASSQWESMWCIQYLALVAPEPAWAAYEGQMSLVRPDGVLEGEGLPSRHVQTAWILYGLTRDRERLRNVYPALKRLLLWKAADPRWVYKGSTPADQKDAGFAASALREMAYARQIASALNLPAEETFWQKRADQLATDFRRWFFVPSGQRMYTRFRNDANAPEGEAIRIELASQLGMPAGLFSPEQEGRLTVAVRTTFPAEYSFLAPYLTGFPEYYDTLRGMWRTGMPDKAATLAEGAMRDIVIAGQFAENYNHDYPPQPMGIVPASNGALMIIDATLAHNGILLGEGLPILVPASPASGVENLRARGYREEAPYTVRFQADGTEITGKGLRLLQRPPSFRPATAPLLWKGQVPPGERIPLRPAP